jgi:uncharacterized membrane protein YagU involved in acid resistance
MRSPVGAGIVAGLIAGVVFGMMMTMMTAPTPDGGQMRMMAMVAQILGSTSLVVGWAYHLFNSAVIGAIFGAIFGWLLGLRTPSWGAGLGWGALYGLAWWVLGGLILMPLLLGMPAFAPLAMPEMRPVAIGSLIGHLIFGLILGAGFVALRRRAATGEEAAARARRAA